MQTHSLADMFSEWMSERNLVNDTAVLWWTNLSNRYTTSPAVALIADRTVLKIFGAKNNISCDLHACCVPLYGVGNVVRWGLRRFRIIVGWLKWKGVLNVPRRTLLFRHFCCRTYCLATMSQCYRQMDRQTDRHTDRRTERLFTNN